mmetsp:Transcript_467/g.1326  ORF Transcript_467/g.1326 Transcript_467/m.1326 type:complete len:237 (-) Transcript_467:248-958(-)
MVCAGRATYDVECNWKFLMENTSETYHTAVVHKDSLGPMVAQPIAPHVGEWDAVRVPSDRSVVPLPGDFPGEHPLPTFASSTAFVNLFPSLQMNVTWDCAWWMWLEPLGVGRTRVHQGFCFPEPTTRLPHFAAVLARYRARWHMAVSEDNAISLNQQSSVCSPARVPGRYAPLEFAVHSFNNYLLGKVLQAPGLRWDPGRRVHVGDGPLWSNADARLKAYVDDAFGVVQAKAKAKL